MHMVLSDDDDDDDDDDDGEFPIPIWLHRCTRHKIKRVGGEEQVGKRR